MTQKALIFNGVLLKAGMRKRLIPFYLTVFRALLTVPIIFFLSLGTGWTYGWACVLLIAAIFSDALDGHLARKWSVETTLGALIDPLADKILVLSVLIFLCFIQKVDPYLVMIIMSRDFYVTGLHIVSAHQNFVLTTKTLAKWKTSVQMAGLFLLMMGMAMSFDYWQRAGYGLLWVSAVMSILSALEYTRVCQKKLDLL